MSRSLDELHPKFRPLVDSFLSRAKQHGIDVVVTCTWRSGAEQDALYAQGRTQPGKVVTNAKAGQSMHNFMVAGKPASLAIDIVPVANGKAVWNAGDPLWASLGQLGEETGLEWAGHWKRFKEYPHFQHPHARDIQGADA